MPSRCGFAASFKVRGRFIHGAMAFSPDGLWLATGAMDGSVERVGSARSEMRVETSAGTRATFTRSASAATSERL